MRMSFCHFNSHYWPAESERDRETHRETDMTPELHVSKSIRAATAQKFILPGISIFSPPLLLHFLIQLWSHSSRLVYIYINIDSHL